MSEGFGARFAPGERYELAIDADGAELQDATGHVAARFAVSPPGEVATAGGRWRSSVERPRFGWVIVFRAPHTDEPVACAYPRAGLSSYDLWIAPDDTYRLRANLLTHVWTLRRGRTKLARISGRAPQRAVTVLEALIPDAQLALAVVLAYETIRYDDLIPAVGGGGGGGG